MRHAVETRTGVETDVVLKYTVLEGLDWTELAQDRQDLGTKYFKFTVLIEE